MARGVLVCALLEAKYATELAELRKLIGDASVVRLGTDFEPEPFPPPPELGPGDLPGPPPARYIIESVLEDGTLLHVSDHRTYGLRKVPGSSAWPDPWQAYVLHPDLRIAFRPKTLGSGTCSVRGLAGLTVAVDAAMRAHMMRPAG